MLLLFLSVNVTYLCFYSRDICLSFSSNFYMNMMLVALFYSFIVRVQIDMNVSGC